MSELITTNEIEIGIDPGRLLFGLSRIGYTTASALCDIIDNSVRAIELSAGKGKAIQLLIRKEHEEFTDNRKNNVKEYVIVDDGCGMDEDLIQNALKLGSLESYETSSLSKFGLGLKSAAFSQGDILQVISAKEGINFVKYVISLPEVQLRKKYFAKSVELDKDDEMLIESYLKDRRGTIIKLSNIRKVNHPSVRSTVNELMEKAGVIYYYFLKDQKIAIRLDEKEVKPIDVLFADEAIQNGNLDENNWDGKTVRWIEKPKTIELDADAGIKATIEVTQLPHPQIFRIEYGKGKDDEIRTKYMIAADNYGYYVYRNKRLISWAEVFRSYMDSSTSSSPREGARIVTQHGDFYGFRGRILIDDSADECFNIDVKKSTITLSEEAWRTISDYSNVYTRKSKKAWRFAAQLVDEIKGKDPNREANEIIKELDPLDILPGQTISPKVNLVEREKEIEKEMQERLFESVHQDKKDSSLIGTEEELPKTQEEIQMALTGGQENPYATKIMRVNSIVDNLLWEPYYDTDRGDCVRINRVHRFARLVFEDNIENVDLQILFELFFHQMSEAEVYAAKFLDSSFPKYSRKDIEVILAEYRRIVSEALAHMCRQLNNTLPPLKSE